MLPDLTELGSRRKTRMCMCKYVDQKGLTAVLAVKRSEGVTLQENLRNLLHLLHAADEACM